MNAPAAADAPDGPSENARVTAAAGVVSAATLLSRIFGFVRDAVIAWFFGAGGSADAFFVAFRIPNLLRRLFAEGALSIAFIPVFSETLVRRGRTEAFALAGAALRLLSVLLALVALVGVLAAPLIIRCIAPGFSASPDKFSLAVHLTRIMFPYIILIGLMALAMGILNVLGHFAAPAIAPLLLNLAMIGSIFFLSPHMDSPAAGLAAGVIIGGILQLALQVPFLIRVGFRFRERTTLFHPALKRIGRLMLPAMFGAAVYQLNILIGTLLASLLPDGSVSYLYYADRLVQFPLGVFAVALATAVLPSLSRQASAQNLAGVKETLGHALRLVFFITLPATVGLIVLREPIVALLFGRGAFDARAVRLTADALLYYGVGLWAFSGVRIVLATFYAVQDTRTPVKIAVVSIAANTGLGLVLMGPLAHGGLALATSLASALNLVLLIWGLRRKLGPLGLTVVGSTLLRSALCSGAMGLAVWFMVYRLFPSISHGGLQRLVAVTGGVTGGAVIYGLLALVFQREELGWIFGKAKG